MLFKPFTFPNGKTAKTAFLNRRWRNSLPRYDVVQRLTISRVENMA